MELINSVRNSRGEIKGEIELSKVYNIIIKPNFQRDLDEQRCTQISQNMSEFFQKFGKYQIIGTVYIAKLNDNFFIIDGQHRLKSAYMMYETTKVDILVDIHLYECENEEQVYKYFQILNSNQQIPNWMRTNNESELVIIKRVISHYHLKYKELVCITDITVQSPKFNISKFFDVAKRNGFFQSIPTMSFDELVNFMDNLNNNVYLSLEKYKTNDIVQKKLDKLNQKVKFGDLVLYLGCVRLSGWEKFFKKKYFTNVNEDIIFNLFTI